jgi:hypothetical protein
MHWSKRPKLLSKNIAKLNAFVNNIYWNVIQIKEEYHDKFAIILKIIFQREKFAHFNNHITITFDLAKKGKKINKCSIMLTQMSIELTQWTKH